MQDTIHGSVISFDNKGILVLGDSGMGKSDLCFRMISELGATLVADDRVVLEQRRGQMYASAPDSLLGKLEVRGVGIVEFEYLEEARIDLVINLAMSLKEVERLPEKEFYNLQDVAIRSVRLYPFEQSTLAKILLVLSDLEIQKEQIVFNS